MHLDKLILFVDDLSLEPVIHGIFYINPLADLKLLLVELVWVDVNFWPVILVINLFVIYLRLVYHFDRVDVLLDYFK